MSQGNLDPCQRKGIVQVSLCRCFWAQRFLGRRNSQCCRLLQGVRPEDSSSEKTRPDPPIVTCERRTDKAQWRERTAICELCCTGGSLHGNMVLPQQNPAKSLVPTPIIRTVTLTHQEDCEPWRSLSP
uniref:Uncharacterized protein n=1 Tax=Knipowitschia caucasica TaxID=637954 RepID=A0AAV2JCB9_KNICA